MPFTSGGDREDDDACDEERLAADQIRRTAAQQQESSEDKRVRVDDPLEARRTEVKGVLDRRQRDVHDVASSTTMNCAMQTSTSTSQRLGSDGIRERYPERVGANEEVSVVVVSVTVGRNPIDVLMCRMTTFSSAFDVTPLRAPGGRGAGAEATRA